MHGEGREEKVCDVFGSLSGGLGSTYSKESGAMSRKKKTTTKKKPRLSQYVKLLQ